MGINLPNAPEGAPIDLPGWVPSGAVHYIAHTEQGEPIRALARAAGCHASTVMRQIRKVEMRRDDPLVDAALRRLVTARAARVREGQLRKTATPADKEMLDDATLTREAMRVLRRLAEAGAVLAVAADMDKAVVVRSLPGQQSARTAVLDAAVAGAMALKEWITPTNQGRIIRYRITGLGRQALQDLMSRFEGVMAAEAQAAQDAREEAEPESQGRPRYGMGESPIAILGRRKDRDGKPFLSDLLVQAGERLREDFELAQLDGAGAIDWDAFVAEERPAAGVAPEQAVAGATKASARVQAALANLGPGLADIALRCCCYLEGLEQSERRLGWSARSGKVVLRIALARLKLYYDETVGPGGGMIG